MKLFVNVCRISRSCSVTYWGISVHVKICEWLFSKMVFFAFHHYLTTNFHLNIFFAGNYISVLFATSHGVSVYCFKHFTSYPCFDFLQIFMHYKKEATMFQIYSKKILHIKPSDKSSGLAFTKYLRNLIMISIWE